jgi:ABC-type dipeptide/oligopeptide/nickel transport system permease subunit
VTGLVVTFGSIVGVIRAVRRRRRGQHSLPAIVFAVIATTITASWLSYWVAHDVRDHSNPINGLLAINFALCVLPMTWLVNAIRAHASKEGEAS